MFKINLHLGLLLICNYLHYGGTVNYNPYASNQPQLLPATNTDNDDYRNNAQTANVDYTVYQQQQQQAVAQQPEQNLQGNSNYQQLYRYYYSPPYQQQQLPEQQQQHQQLQPHQPTQVWSGPPIVVEEDDIQERQSATANIPPTLYQQHPTGSRYSNALPPPVYSPTATRTAQFHYNNNNNNNIVYHRDFRHQIDATIPVPVSQHNTHEDNTVSWNNQQQQQQHQLLEQQLQQHHQQPQQFYATNTNLQRYNGISNDLTSLRKDSVSVYRDHFKRYLENNPRRIKPIY